MISNIGKLLLVGAVALCSSYASYGGFFDVGGSSDFNLGKKGKRDFSDLSNARADYWTVIDKNIIVKGHVFIPYKNFMVYADKAILNTETRDLEAVGNVRLYHTKIKQMTVTIDELDYLKTKPRYMIIIDGYTIDPVGMQKIKITVYERGDALRAHKVSGNLNTGLIEFKDLYVSMKGFVCEAEHGLRKPGGELDVQNAKFSSCEYMSCDHEHYSLSCSSAKIYPRNGVNEFGFSGYNPDLGEHHVIMKGVTMNVMGMPILWLPYMYKPPDESPGLFQMHGGETKNWGGFLFVSKRFQLSEAPYAMSRVMLDWYSLRGVGYGAKTSVATENSNTDIFAYSIHDIRPTQEYKDIPSRRLDIPHARYDFRISNITHITPRLDFRGRYELLSDFYFRDEFFSDAAYAYPQPTTFGALEYQGDRFSASLYSRVRVNDFYTVVEKLPEFSLNVPRQELFKNIYYQGDTRIGYYQMKWRKFDKDRILGNKIDPENYESGRVDSLHFFYYPVNLGWLNLVPRAGVRFTAYSNSSKRSINGKDLAALFVVDNPYTPSNLNITNYDNNGGSKFRAIGEFGLQATTKISRAWQNVKSGYWQLDGIRHIMEPYVNYTYVTDPSESRDYLFYFDDADRIIEQNFVRFGVKNRLQTRRGNFGSESIYTWLSLENYLDYRFTTYDGFKHLGDLGTRLEFKPNDALSFSTTLLLDTGQSNEHKNKTLRHGRILSRKGISNKWINRWDATITYKIIEDVVARFSYLYRDQYSSQGSYSMGSTLSDFDTGTVFNKYNIGRTQTFQFGLDFPITLDRKTRGSYEINYDVEEGAIRDQRLRIWRSLHCWQVAVELIAERSWDAKDGSDIDYSFMVTLALNQASGPMEQIQRRTYKRFTEKDGGS